MPRLTPDQLAARGHGMGSTDVVEACGLAPWAGAGPVRLYCEKRGIVQTDQTEGVDDDAREALDWGHDVEPVLLVWYARTRGVTLFPGGHQSHPTEPWLFATLDATVMGESLIVEAKNVGSPRFYCHWDPSSLDGIPDYVRAQASIAMACSSRDACDVVASVGGRPPHVWRVHRDVGLERVLIDSGRRFWQMVQSETWPTLDHTPASKTLLRDRYPANVERVMRDAAELDGLGIARAAALDNEREAKREKDRLDAEIMRAIGDADGIEGTGWKMTWKIGRDGVRRQRFTSGREP